MMNIRQVKTLLLLGLVCTVTASSIGQSNFIGLEEAIQMARKNYSGLERDRLVIDQQNKLAEAGLLVQPTQIFLSGEEFNFDDYYGVHSLNIQQNFYLPKASRAQRDLYKSSAALAKKQMALTGHELDREVKKSYYQLLYANQELELVAEGIELYGDFLSVTSTHLETGEKGKIPQLAARSRLGQAQLDQKLIVEKYQIAFTLFNLWLQSDTLYDVNEKLPIQSIVLEDSINQNNPHLQVVQARQDLAIANIEAEKARVLPQINSGLRLQNSFGKFPLIGYQLGLNIPLFRKAYKHRIAAAEVGVKVEEATLRTESRRLERTSSELENRIENQFHILKYLQEELTPIVNEQSEVNLVAYTEGAISYLEYLDSLEQVVKVKHQYLAALYKINVLQVELDYWMGR